jgi:hypothetical protein
LLVKILSDTISPLHQEEENAIKFHCVGKYQPVHKAVQAVLASYQFAVFEAPKSGTCRHLPLQLDAQFVLPPPPVEILDKALFTAV